KPGASPEMVYFPIGRLEMTKFPLSLDFALRDRFVPMLRAVTVAPATTLPVESWITLYISDKYVSERGGQEALEDIAQTKKPARLRAGRAIVNYEPSLAAAAGAAAVFTLVAAA